MDDHIAPAGWTAMFSTDAAGHRVRHEPADARFFEYASSGPGAHDSATRPLLTTEQAARHDALAVLEGWDPRR